MVKLFPLLLTLYVLAAFSLDSGLRASAGPKAQVGDGQDAPAPTTTPALVVAPTSQAPARAHATPAPTPRVIANNRPAPTPDHRSERERILDVGRELLGQRETHGNNRSPVIDKMNRLTGVPMGSPYCASFNAWTYDQAGIAHRRFPVSAWSPSWVARPTWTRKNGGRTPLPGDAFGIYFRKLGRVGHTGLVEKWQAKTLITVEANTSPSAEFQSENDRNGDGIWRKRRLHSQLHAVRNWLD